MHPVGSYCTDISRYTVNKTLNMYVNTGALQQDHPGPAVKLYTNLYGIYHCRVYSE